MGKVFFHVDMDAFFASVEIHDHPEYRGLPVIIGGIGVRSVVSTASYEARKYGVHSAMSGIEAHKRCPEGIFLKPNMKRYSEVSSCIMEIFSRYSSEVTQISIDEAFLDMTGTQRLFGNPKECAKKLKTEVFEKTGLTISVGIAANRFIAKMASDYNKPDGLCVVSVGKEEKFVDTVGLNKLWGVGKSTREELSKAGIRTTQELREYSLDYLKRRFGEHMGQFLYSAARGIDPGICSSESKSHSISSEKTFIEDILSRDELLLEALSISHEVMFRSMEEHVMAKTVGIKLRYADFRTITAQITPDNPILNGEQVWKLATSLIDRHFRQGDRIRLLGIGLYQTYDGDAPEQYGLFDDDDTKKRNLELTVLKLSEKGNRMLKASEVKLEQ